LAEAAVGVAEDCGTRELARSFANLGQPEIALYTLCSTEAAQRTCSSKNKCARQLTADARIRGTGD